MKVKLLKKIRRRYNIMTNASGVLFYGEKTEFKYLAYDKNCQYTYLLTDNFQECKDWVLNKVRQEYKSPKKHSPNIKIWY